MVQIVTRHYSRFMSFLVSARHRIDAESLKHTVQIIGQRSIDLNGFFVHWVLKLQTTGV